MPSDIDGDKLERAMVAALRENAGKVEAVVAQVETKLERSYERTAQLLADYRQDVYRTTMGIHARLLSYEDGLTKDSAARTQRQSDIDVKLAAIEYNQRFLVRLAVVAGLVALGVVIGWLVL